MKKFVAVLLTLMLTLGVVGAMADEPKIELSLGIWPQDTDERSLAVNENYNLPAFEEMRPDVEVVKAPYEYNPDTFIPLVESGNLPVLFRTYFTEPDMMIRNGFVADITAQLEEKGWIEMMNPAVRELVTGPDGKYYGIPEDMYPLGLMINAELFREAGLVDDAGIPLYPKTWDEVVEVGVKIKEETGAAGICILAKDNAAGWHFSNIAWNYGAQLETVADDGTVTANLNSPEAVAAMQLIRDMKWEHDILTSDPTAEDWGTGFQQLGTGNAAMYLAGDNAVNQPTNVYGLPKEDLMFVGMPAGPGGAYTLTGGNLYMFSKDATAEQITAGLDWLEVIGRAPIMTDSVREGRVADAQNNVDMGVPVMKSLKVWNVEEYNALLDEIYEEYVNVDPAMFAPFYEAVEQDGALHAEEPVQAQEMYAEIAKAMQEVITNESADVQEAMDTANANFQAFLDEHVNN